MYTLLTDLSGFSYEVEDGKIILLRDGEGVGVIHLAEDIITSEAIYEIEIDEDVILIELDPAFAFLTTSPS